MGSTSNTRKDANPPAGEGAKETSSTEGGVCPVCKGLGYLRADVPVGHPDFGQLVPCSCQLAQVAERRVSTLRAMSDLDFLARMTFDTFSPEVPGLPPSKQANLRLAFEQARAFAEKPEGWLLLQGSYGCGKTHLAAAIANACVERGQPVLFITVPDLLDHLRASFGPSSAVGYDARFEQVRMAPVLILDDLGTESSTPWAQEKLFQILNHRYNAELPTVITTNHNLEDIPLRLRSRLQDLDLVLQVVIKAPDYRLGLQIPQDQSDLSSLRLHHDQLFDNFDLRKGELERGEWENLQRAVEIARGFAEEPADWLVLTGEYGTGKTHLAAAIANHRVTRGYPALFVLVPDLLDHLRATFNPQSTITFYQQFDEVRRTPLLILDDLGTESATPWAREKLHQVFDYRYNARLPTVITTATPIEDLDPRLATRMLDVSRCILFALVVPPYRGALPRKKTRSRGKGR